MCGRERVRKEIIKGERVREKGDEECRTNDMRAGRVGVKKGLTQNNASLHLLH